MTTNELYDLFSQSISSTFNASTDEISKRLFEGITGDMTEAEIYSKMILNSIIISANLATQVAISGLISMGIIPQEMVHSMKLRPDLHLVKPLTENSFKSSSDK